MPITVTFDLSQPTSMELNRIRSFFEWLGWEHLGNTAYRYPSLDDDEPTEDWFNHVIPALMLLRTSARYAATTGRDIQKFSIDVQSSTGHNPSTAVGKPPLPGRRIPLVHPLRGSRAFGRQRLVDWIDDIAWPYAPVPGTGTVGT